MDHRAKLQRARNHLKTLDDSIGVFLKSDPYKLAVTFNEKEGGYTAVLVEVTDIPKDWSLIVGDIVHNMRSALDNLAYSLACKNLGRVPTGDEAKDIQFVIIDNAAGWEKQRKRWLRHLSGTAQDTIQRFQPYHRTDLTKRHALSVVRDLSNVDKHRHIVVALAVASSSSIELSGEYLDPGSRVIGFTGPIKQGTVIARWNFAVGEQVVPGHLHGEVNAHGKLGLDVQFANAWPAWGGSVMGAMPGICDFIEATIFPPLETLL